MKSKGPNQCRGQEPWVREAGKRASARALYSSEQGPEARPPTNGKNENLSTRITGPGRGIPDTGSRLTSSIHISPMSISPTILNSRISLVASGSV